MFCQCHWSLPMWGPLPTAGVQCPMLRAPTVAIWHHFCLPMKLLVPILLTRFVPNVPKNVLWYSSFIEAFYSYGMFHRTWARAQSEHQILKSIQNHPCPLSLFIVPLTKYISLDRLLWAKESSEALDSSLKADPCKTNPASYPGIRTQDRWTRFCLSWEPRHAAAAVKLTDSQSLSGNRNILFCVSGNPESDHFSPPLLQCPVQATVPFLLMTSPASGQHPLPPLLPPLPLLAVLNTATRVISWKHKPDHVTPLLEFLQWLPVSLKNESQSPYKAFEALPWPTPNYLSLPAPYSPSLHMLIWPHWFPCYSWNRHQAPSSPRSLALPVPSTWNSLSLVANTASPPSLNLYSNLAFWTSFP